MKLHTRRLRGRATQVGKNTFPKLKHDVGKKDVDTILLMGKIIVANYIR